MYYLCIVINLPGLVVVCQSGDERVLLSVCKHCMLYEIALSLMYNGPHWEQPRERKKNISSQPPF